VSIVLRKPFKQKWGHPSFTRSERIESNARSRHPVSTSCNAMAIWLRGKDANRDTHFPVRHRVFAVACARASERTIEVYAIRDSSIVRSPAATTRYEFRKFPSTIAGSR
jgi:hypothetical protein